MYEIIEKIGKGNRGEVFKVEFKGKIAALKWFKNDLAVKEFNILKLLNGVYAPKPFFLGKHYFIMEYIDGKPLKNLDKLQYYNSLKMAFEGAYYLDKLGIFHKQLGRYYHIFTLQGGIGEEEIGKRKGRDEEKRKKRGGREVGIKFIDFERAVITKNPRNFLQLVGYYLQRDDNFDKTKLSELIVKYKNNPLSGVEFVRKIFDEVINKKI